MFTLLRSKPWRQSLAEQLPTLVPALLIAELFYKWHSFTLECLGFLATWAVLDAAATLIRHLRADRAPRSQPVAPD